MNVFENNPNKVRITGNIINRDLRELDDMTVFRLGAKSTIAPSGTRTVDGKVYPVIKMQYQG
jgi:hypothetical protein